MTNKRDLNETLALAANEPVVVQTFYPDSTCAGTAQSMEYMVR